MISKIETAIAIKDKDEAIPALATAQVLSLFGLNTQVLTHTDLEKADLPNESVILLMENQIRTTLTKLRRQKWAGAVVILSSTSDQDLSQKYAYILKYGKNTNNASWGKPYLLSDLLTKLSQLEPLRKGNLDLLAENIEKANQKFQEAIEQLSQDINKLPDFTPNSSELSQQLNQIEQQFERLFSPLSKHTKITLKNYGEATISSHFRHLITEINTKSKLLDHHLENLQKIVITLSKQMQDLGEDLEMCDR
jgi:chaperonin cofactor prefoldin